MVSILDQFGRPIRKTDLAATRARPTLAGVRSVISGHPAEGLTPRRLAQIHRDAAEGEPLGYLELAEDIEERDLHYSAVMSTRRRQVSQIPITVAAASEESAHKEHAEFVQNWLKEGVLQAALFDMLDAIGKGFSVLEIDWHFQRGRLAPRELVYRPQRWFTFDRDDGETVLLREGIAGVPLPPHAFIVHRHKAKSGLTVRSGLARVASWAWMYKAFTQKDWALFAQNFGMPIRIGKYHDGASPEEKDVLWSAVANIAGDCAAIIHEAMNIELVEVGSKGDTAGIYEKRSDWLDRQVSKAVLGQTTTTDAVSGGHAVAKEHRLVQEDIERADAILVAATINAQLIPNLVAFNFGPQELYPTIAIGRPDDPPLEIFSKSFAELAPLGLTAEASYLRQRLGIPEPQKDAELVGGRAPAPTVPGQPGPVAGPLVQSRMNRSAGDIEDVLLERIQEEAAGAMSGLSEQVRTALMSARDLGDAKRRLEDLQLSRDDLVDAMSRGLALAHLAGRAALVDDLRGRR